MPLFARQAGGTQALPSTTTTQQGLRPMVIGWIIIFLVGFLAGYVVGRKQPPRQG
ncbi:MAG: hypothetical protein ACO3DD_03980 [Burkholderiaceae bacterium]|jgi:hypothetical protein